MVHGVLEAKLDDIALLPPTLVHGDFWTGNTIAYRGRVTGLVDWGGASLGDPRIDVAGCRLDFVLTHGADLVDAFRQAYERLAGAPLPQLWFFDLLRGLEPLLECEHWLEGYVDFGLHVPLADAEGRLRAFLTRALEESGR